MVSWSDHLSKGEIRKDAVQSAVEAAATTVGDVTMIITGAVRDVAGAVGGFATELFEIRDAAKKASDEHVDVETSTPTGGEPVTDSVEE